ncbi:MAG: hypothetical protein HYX29_04875 [Solirubrobacterales bacterium]|nr:hypothetical protein [Solirubrobacterales bacterium]
MTPNGQEIGSRVGSALPPSVSRKRREVMVAGYRAPHSASSTRAKHLRKLVGARKYIWAIALIGGGVFLIGASTGKVLFAVVPLLIVVAVVVSMVWREATRLAARDFFAGYALDHRFNFSERMSLMETTPLLGAGDRRHCENYMEGPLEGVDDVAVGLAHFVFETREDRADRRKRPITVYAPHHYTIAVVDLPRAMRVFPGVFLSRRGGFFGRDDWLDRPSLAPVELESSELASKYQLLVRNNQDRGRLLELFKPTFQIWLGQLPFQIFFEYSGGTLVVYVPKRLKEGRDLDAMLAAASWIARRIIAEGEPLNMVEESQAPPTGVDAFPSPPPPTKPHVEPTLRVAPEPVVVEDAFRRASVPPPTLG